MQIVSEPKHEGMIMSNFGSLINAFERVMAVVSIVGQGYRKTACRIMQPERFGTVLRTLVDVRRQLAGEPALRF